MPSGPSAATEAWTPRIDSLPRGLETEWENRLRDLAEVEAELRRREQQRPGKLDQEQLKRIQILGSDIRQIWAARGARLAAHAYYHISDPFVLSNCRAC